MKRICADCAYFDDFNPTREPICAQDNAPRDFDGAPCDKFTWLDNRLAALERVESRLLELREYRNTTALLAMDLLELIEPK